MYVAGFNGHRLQISRNGKTRAGFGGYRLLIGHYAKNDDHRPLTGH